VQMHHQVKTGIVEEQQGRKPRKGQDELHRHLYCIGTLVLDTC
jgi:hypothetical protein